VTVADRTGVWLGGLRVADLETRNGLDLRLRYTAEALDRWPPLSPVLSCSLPLAPGRTDAWAFGRGLLPEGQALASMAKDAGVAVNATFALLARYGRDVAGALVIADTAPEEDRGHAEPYVENGLAAAVDALDGRPLDLHDDSELSLAGFEDKLLLVDTPDGWARPVGGRPSTHILKRDNLRHRGIVDAEAAALRIARTVGLTTIDPQLVDLGGFRCLIVDRFDRRIGDDGAVTRVHQEDACQALGIDPDDRRGRAKYEADGGPGFRDVATLLRSYAEDGPEELKRLLRAMVFTVLIGNADAHGKNVALLHPTPETIELAPLYDTVPTALWPALRDRAAMAIGGQDRLPAVTVDDLQREARAWRMGSTTVRQRIADAIEEVREAAAACEHEALRAFVRNRASALARG
jgi:serine/threonine-protein kinase HipA